MDSDQLELNQGDNFYFGMDISLSMGTTDCPGGASRSDYCKEQAVVFAREAGKYDTDGITVLTFGAGVTVFDGITPDKAADIIGALRPKDGLTNTHLVIDKALELHKKGGYKQSVLMLVTDGAPSDRNAVKASIVKASKECPGKSFLISILTVGNIDAGLQDWLTYLDDGIKKDVEGYEDIVDVKKLESVNFVEAFVGAATD